MKDEVENKLLDGCGKPAEFMNERYKCGQFEDLKHSNHIILCKECWRLLKQHRETKQIMIKKFEELIDELIEKTTCINCSEEYEYAFSICRYNIRELKSKLKELGE